jgi:hypothetical protein
LNLSCPVCGIAWFCENQFQNQKRRNGLTSACDQPDHEAVAAPKLNVVAINQLLCPYGSIGIAIG